jgi:RNA polymerase-binding transcription factor DksA
MRDELGRDQRLRLNLISGHAHGRNRHHLREIKSRRADDLTIAAASNSFARISNGSFGICSDRNEEIAFERLVAYPAAKRCLAY